MTDEQLLEVTKKLVAVESTLSNPKGLQEVYDMAVRMLLDSGKEITIEQFEKNGKPSFIAFKGRSRPDNFRIILNGHLDVVPGKPHQYKAEIKDGKLYGRGVYDMKAACVLMINAFCEFVDKVPYALGLQIVTDEEASGTDGTYHQIRNGVRGDFIICGECGRSTTAFEIANESKGLAILEIGFPGNSSHGAYPWKGDNAAIKATRFVHELHKLYPVPTEETSQTTATVTSISTNNDAVNKTPDYATVQVDIRFLAEDPDFRSKKHLAALVEQIDPTAEITKFYHFSAPVYTNPKNPLLLCLKASAEKVEGAKFSLVKRHGSNDGRFYGDVGDQACEFGIAGEHQHGDKEYITLEAFSNYRATLDDFLNTTIETEKENTNTRAYNG